MDKKLSTPLVIVLLATLFFALVVLNNQLLSSARLDLTENQVFSLSEGSKKILNEIDEPINLYLFYSDKASKGMTTLRNYANRVQSLLEEYAKSANGKINLNVVDPVPFSEQEDQADQFGLTAATLGPAGDAIYLGLAATNAFDDQEIIAFFDPQQEAFLEYEVSKLLYKLSDPQPVHVTVLTDLPISGGQNPMTGRFDPPWTAFEQLNQLYQVENIDSTATALPEQTDVLVVVHPKALNDQLMYALDQYALGGGRMLVFVDPHSESDPAAMMGGMNGMGPNSSDLQSLFDAWGVEFDSENVLLDAMLGLDIRTQNGGVARHFGIVGLGPEQLDRDDVTTAGLEVINGSSFGVLSKQPQSQVTWQPLMVSSTNADLIDSGTYAFVRDPMELSKQYQSEEKSYVLAARLSGVASSAFDEAPEGIMAEHLTQTRELNVVVVGDTDLLADRFWVQQASFFGQTVYTPFANNGDYVTNSVENLGGSSALISIRSRGTFARPFTRVEALTVSAEEKFREQEQLLQQQLEETENQLAQLQEQQSEGGMLVLSADQQQAVDEFMQKRIEIRKALRDVRHQLDKDIEQLGNWLKFVNIAVAPVLLTLLLMLFARMLRLTSRRQGGQG